MPVCFIFMQSQVMLLDLQAHSAPKYALPILRSRGKSGYKQSIHKLVKTQILHFQQHQSISK